MNNFKGPLTLILGPLIGLLVMAGYVDPKNTDDVTQQLNLLVGALITIVTAVSALHHDIELKKIDASKTASPTQPLTVVGDVTNVVQEKAAL